MKHRFSFAQEFSKHLVVIIALGFLASCTYYVPAKLETERNGDTLTVALAGNGAARWDPQKDSVVIHCAECSTHDMVEHFYDRNDAEYAIQNSTPLTLTFYSLGRSETINLPGTPGDAPSTTYEMHSLHEHHAHRVAREEKSAVASAPATPADAPKTVKKASAVKVTAAEGVAVYSDKTKTNVLKIIPQGTILTLLSKEGNLYSVSVDGQEGFVDAEAVTEQ